jgi:hypothetical protein
MASLLRTIHRWMEEWIGTSQVRDNPGVAGGKKKVAGIFLARLIRRCRWSVEAKIWDQ